MKKLKKKIRRHPNREKLWGTILMWFIGVIFITCVMGYEKPETTSQIKNLGSVD